MSSGGHQAGYWMRLSYQAEVQLVGQFACAVMMCCHVAKRLSFQSEPPFVPLQPAGRWLRLNFFPFSFFSPTSFSPPEGFVSVDCLLKTALHVHQVSLLLENGCSVRLDALWCQSRAAEHVPSWSHENPGKTWDISASGIMKAGSRNSLNFDWLVIRKCGKMDVCVRALV